MFVDASTDRVGIGTSSPSGLLNLSASNAFSFLYHDVFDDGASEAQIVLRKSDTDTKGTFAETDSGDLLGSLQFHGVDSGSNADLGAYIRATQVGASGTRVPAKLEFVTYNSSAANTAMTLDSSGNLGIGTTTPDALLTITGTGKVLDFTKAGTSHQFLDFTNTSGRTVLGVESSVGGQLLTGSTAYATVLASENAFPLQLGTNGATNMTIAS